MNRLLALAVSCCAAVCGSAEAQSNIIWPNDDCVFATPISGSGAFGFDTGSTFVTTSLPPVLTCTNCTCGTQFIGIANDVWYLWTATCSGPVEMMTGTQSDPAEQCNLDTVLAVYNTPCPALAAPPIVCCDDTCGQVGNTCDLASYVKFDVECGQQYLIRVGSKPGTPGGAGTLKINCLGAECPPPAEQVCANCCGAKPQFDDQFYQANYTGQVAVVTANDDAQGPSGTPVVTIFNLQCSNPPPVPGQEWNAAPGGPTTAFRYSGATGTEWTKNHLGSVFGLTLDDQGNIYAAHSGIYGVLGGAPFSCVGLSTAIGNAGSTLPNTSTSVFVIPAGTGIPEVFVNLPGGSQNDSDPGLGNINFDCEHDEFFVSHFGDGRIYRINSAGTILGWYDHATNTIGLGALPDPLGPYNDFVPLGERVWAVQAHQGRLYYSVWGENKDIFQPTTAVGPAPNRIWSIALTPGSGGDFVAGSRQQEIQPPVHPGSTYFPAFLGASAPVSDISFSPSCRMVLAERDMSANNCTLAHGARALEYQFTGASWTPTSNFRGGYGYEIGDTVSLTGTNSVGGVDYDFAPQDNCAAGRLWVTGDALVPTSGGTVYGFTGLDTSTPFGTTNLLSLPIDYNGTYVGFPFDKSKQGDVEIPCSGAEPCLAITNEHIRCEISGGANGTPPALTGCYTYTYTLTNNSGQTVQYVLVPNANISPNVITLNPPLLNGQSVTVTTTICDVKPGEEFCFDLILADAKVQECCTFEHCVEISDCECLQVLQSEVLCDPTGGGGNTFSFNFTLQNLTNDVVEHMFVFPPLPPDPNSNITITPQYTDVPTTPPFATTGPHNVTLTFPVAPAPGSQVCIRISLHNASMGECCSKVVCITIPDCPQQLTCPPDVVPNGVVDVDDLLMMINKWGMDDTYCDIAPQPTGDGTVNVDDLLMVINAWGPCPNP
jgi:hypothetical protein